MGAAISIPQAMKKMDGIFGYKVVSRNGSDGAVNFAVQEKDIFDLIFDVFLSRENYPQTRANAIAAFRKIAEQIEGADNGEFKTLVENYAISSEPIDYSRIREVLKTSLRYHPPRVYSRAASNKDMNQNSNNTILADFQKLYLQNIRKSICNEEAEIEIFREGPFGSVSDQNLEALADAMFLHWKEGGAEVEIVEPDFHIGTRMELMRYEKLKISGAIFKLDAELRIEILNYRLELLKHNPGISYKEIKVKETSTFRESEEYVKKELEKISFGK